MLMVARAKFGWRGDVEALRLAAWPDFAAAISGCDRVL